MDITILLDNAEAAFSIKLPPEERGKVRSLYDLWLAVWSQLKRKRRIRRLDEGMGGSRHRRFAEWQTLAEDAVGRLPGTVGGSFWASSGAGCLSVLVVAAGLIAFFAIVMPRNEQAVGLYYLIFPIALGVQRLVRLAGLGKGPFIRRTAPGYLVTPPFPEGMRGVERETESAHFYQLVRVVAESYDTPRGPLLQALYGDLTAWEVEPRRLTEPVLWPDLAFVQPPQTVDMAARRELAETIAGLLRGDCTTGQFRERLYALDDRQERVLFDLAFNLAWLVAGDHLAFPVSRETYAYLQRLMAALLSGEPLVVVSVPARDDRQLPALCDHRPFWSAEEAQARAALLEPFALPPYDPQRWGAGAAVAGKSHRMGQRLQAWLGFFGEDYSRVFMTYRDDLRVR